MTQHSSFLGSRKQTMNWTDEEISIVKEGKTKINKKIKKIFDQFYLCIKVKHNKSWWLGLCFCFIYVPCYSSLRVFSGFGKYGKDFSTIARTVANKSEQQVKNFYHNFKKKHGLDQLISESKNKKKVRIKK